MVLAAVHGSATREDRSAMVAVFVVGVMNVRRARSSCGDGECILDTVI